MLKHDPEQALFQFVQDDDIAVMKYKLMAKAEDGQPCIDFYSTFVPESLRGKGIAEKLVRAGLKWATNNNYHIMASCWYVDKFLRKKQ